ncbi:MAG: LCP family protein [Candidatus Margulisiibacteriota bacterium]
MAKKLKRPDVLRIIALLVYFLLLIYLWIFIFIPKALPLYLTVFIPDHKMNLLIMGVDHDYDKHSQRMTASRRADTLILAHIDPFNKRIELISIPRDSMAEIPGRGEHKVNAAYGFGGEKLAMDVVSKMIDVHIDHFVSVDLRGLIDLVDSVGGIKIFVEKDMHYVDVPADLNINLKKGLQKLSGKEAEEYVRFRGDALADIGRTDRQKKFIKALSLRLASPAALVRLPFSITAIKRSVSSDMSFWQMIRIANLARMARPSDIGQHTIPGDFGQGNLYGYWIVDEQRISELKQKLRL